MNVSSGPPTATLHPAVPMVIPDTVRDVGQIRMLPGRRSEIPGMATQLSRLASGGVTSVPPTPFQSGPASRRSASTVAASVRPLVVNIDSEEVVDVSSDEV